MSAPGNPIEVSEENGIRSLHFGSDWVQGAMRIRRPNSLELTYTREMAACLLFRPPAWPRRVLLIGLGAGSLSKFFYHHVPHSRLTVVEIDPRVVMVAAAQFRLPDEDARLRIVIDDGADYVQRRADHFDAILLDGYDHNARAGALDSAPFYAACRAALRPQGLLAVNLFGQRRGFKASVGRIAEAFDGHVLTLPANESGNVVAFAGKSEPRPHSLATLEARATELRQSTTLDLRASFKRLAQAGLQDLLL